MVKTLIVETMMRMLCDAQELSRTLETDTSLDAPSREAALRTLGRIAAQAEALLQSFDDPSEPPN